MTTGSNGDSLAVPNVILQGFATGTLLYVIFFEILSKDRSGMIPYLSVLIGFVLMSVIQYIGELFCDIYKNYLVISSLPPPSI